jgi:hypothetical protein
MRGLSNSTDVKSTEENTPHEWLEIYLSPSLTQREFFSPDVALTRPASFEAKFSTFKGPGFEELGENEFEVFPHR